MLHHGVPSVKHEVRLSLNEAAVRNELTIGCKSACKPVAYGPDAARRKCSKVNLASLAAEP